LKQQGGDVSGELTGGTPAGAEYGLACEHSHSCCILLGGRIRIWSTESGTRGSTTKSFRTWRRAARSSRARTTCCPRRTGACGARRKGGFDPGETRVRKVRNHPGKDSAQSSPRPPAN
jgi:tRNA wybutosine-synthesizing protein 1